jgi:hypothetical protein
MAADDPATDESSIKPVSSLRSRFENMATTERQPSQSSLSSSIRRSMDTPRPTVPDNTPQVTKKLKPPPPKPRPVSTTYPLTPRHSPPTVSIQSPASESRCAHRQSELVQNSSCFQPVYTCLQQSISRPVAPTLSFSESRHSPCVGGARLGFSTVF